MDTDDILKPPKKDKFLHIVITEIVCVFLLIMVVLITKYFFCLFRHMSVKIGKKHLLFFIQRARLLRF